MFPDTLEVLESHILVTDYLNLEVHTNLSYIKLSWKRQVNQAELQEGFRKAVDLAARYKCKFWLGDARKSSFLDIADRDFLVRDLVRMMSQAGIQKVARLVNADEVALKNSLSMRFQIESRHMAYITFETQLFLDDQSAEQWLFA